jgi:cytochrome c5
MKKIHLNFVAIKVAAVLAVALIGASASKAGADESKPAAAVTTNSVSGSVAAPGAKSPTVAKKLTGAELYSIHCNRCHAERYPTERTAAQWKTVMLHMQVRAGIPGQQSKLILQYLQENSGR